MYSTNNSNSKEILPNNNLIVPYLFHCKAELIHFFSSFHMSYNQGQFTIKTAHIFYFCTS